MLGADVGTALMAQVFSLDLSLALAAADLLRRGVLPVAQAPRAPGQIGRVLIGLGLIILALQLVMQATAPITQAQGVQGDLRLALRRPDARHADRRGASRCFSWSSLAVVLLSATLAASNVVSVPVALGLVLGANLGSGLLALLVNVAHPGRRAPRRLRQPHLQGGRLHHLRHRAAAGRSSSSRTSTPTRAARCVHFHVALQRDASRSSSSASPTRWRALVTQRFLPQVAEPRAADRAQAPRPGALIDRRALALANAARETLRIGDTIEQMLHGMLEVIRTNDARQGRGGDQARRRRRPPLHRGQALPHPDQPRGARREGRPALDRDHVAHHQPRARGRHHRAHHGQDLRDKKIAHAPVVLRGRACARSTELHETAGRQPAPRPVGVPERRREERAAAAGREGALPRPRARLPRHAPRPPRRQTVQSIETSSLHLDIISDLRRINSFFCSTAYPILEQAGQLRSSRLRARRHGHAPRASRADRRPPRDARRPRRRRHGTARSPTSRSSSATTATSSTAARA